MHGAHQDPVLQLGKAEIQGSQQGGIKAHDAAPCKTGAQGIASTLRREGAQADSRGIGNVG
ncbi:hypothetical protein D3C79_1077760 [compost metagenome]